jgi:hypothetical protein
MIRGGKNVPTARPLDRAIRTLPPKRGQWLRLYNAPMADAATPEPVARVILLGASNLTKCISLIVETAWNLLGSPLDVKAAMGHGRPQPQEPP